jgi:hypothetical protein
MCSLHEVHGENALLYFKLCYVRLVVVVSVSVKKSLIVINVKNLKFEYWNFECGNWEFVILEF